MTQAHLSILFVLLVALLLLSAFFSGSETALMAVSRLRLKSLARSKPNSVRLVERLLERSDRLIGTILLGNNLVNVAMSSIATYIAVTFWGEAGIVYVTGVLTVVILVFSEITPKVYAKHHNEPVSFAVAPLLNGIIIVLSPLMVGITFLTNKFLLLLGVDASKLERPLYDEEMVKTCIRMSHDDGAITSEEKDMLSRVFTLDDLTVDEIMVPKDKMVMLHIDADEGKIIETILATGHTRFPVHDGTDVLGSVHIKDLFELLESKARLTIKTILRPPYFISASKKIDAQLRSFRSKKIHQAIVLDNSGAVIGLVTLEDILEELVGAIHDEHDD